MKWFFALLLALIIFGGAAWFGYNFVFKEDIQVRKEQRGEVTAEPRLDLTLPDYEAAAKLRQEGKIPEARAALTAFVQKYQTSHHADQAKDLLGEVMAWNGGKRVGFGTKEFIGSTRWIRLSSQTYTIYSMTDSAHPALSQPPPPQGLGLAAADVEELSSLVNSKTPVTITD